ncbi:hypothetical protein Ctob_000943 [Chrysochromulina tobinii]|uniref:Uncharacterized protein n=1 Tax=Chrysochromulina tobinii TaxID=1460289 RepID=A0A0M0J4X5_9EUKA|nr:hypothetical protein Ctob_000943 [Chrysochromulina tobinii]|eukprot:KOO21669.1 hypothetical protein Ctob_000943 [Chrysochromulina sp. CCMP291]
MQAPLVVLRGECAKGTPTTAPNSAPATAPLSPDEQSDECERARWSVSYQTAVIALGNWIPASIAVASVLLALQDYWYIPSHLEATNRALREIHAMLNYWESLSLVQRKTRRVKLLIATCCEGAVLGICASRTAVSPVLPIKCGDGLEEKKE